jgi:PKD domain
MQFFSSLKPLRQLLLIAVVAVAAVSCNSDDPAPTVSVSITNASQSAGLNAAVTVTASASGGDNITYAWTQISGPTATLTNAATATVAFTTGLTAATYVLQVTATNSAGNSATAIATISAAQNLVTINNIDGGTGVIAIGTPIRITTSRTLTADKVWRIRGYVSVEGGATLTIEPGTVLLGEKSSNGTLIIKTDGILNAVGTETKPIVFTSDQAIGQRNRGDWGGIVWLGNGISNQGQQVIEGLPTEFTYGKLSTDAGAVNTANNGSLRYARIEFAGIPQQPNQETNGLTMGALGNGTTIDHIQVTLGKDDAYEWFGGAVNLKYIVAYRTEDDDLDSDFGYAGNVQFAFVLRDLDISNESNSEAIESDNNGTGTTATPLTSAIFSNVTALGPGRPQGFTIPATHFAGAHIRRNTSISIFNSAIVGFASGLVMDGTTTEANYLSGAGVISNNIIMKYARLYTSNSTVSVTGAAGPAGLLAPKAVAATSTAQLFFETGRYVNVQGSYTIAGANNLFNGTISTNDTLAAAQGTPRALNSNNMTTVIGLPLAAWNTDGSADVDPKPTSGSPLLTGGNFTNAKLNGNTFFAVTAYRGAFDASATGWNLTTGWLNWAPQSKNYQIPQ